MPEDAQREAQQGSAEKNGARRNGRQEQTSAAPRAERRRAPVGPRYKWVALTNTTLGSLMATIDASIVLISLPVILKGIHVNPLAPDESGYFLWILLGYMVVTATLLVTFGRISDMFGRVRFYNLGFLIFTFGSILLSLTPGTGNTGALELIIFRLIQGVGAGFLLSNSAAIITDAFPASQRGFALGINQIAAILGSIVGLILGGILSYFDWRLVFLVSVPVGIAGTIWAYMMLRETTTPSRRQRIDWLGNITFAAGATILLLGITYGIEPYGDSPVGWNNPLVLGAVGLGALLLVAFVVVEFLVPDPMFRLRLFRIRMFAAGNASSFLASVARGGLQFMLVIWLQGIWLPLHGYDYSVAPLWAGIYMIPQVVGFLVMGPISGFLSDRFGARPFSTTGMLIQAGGFFLLTMLPLNFEYVWFGLILFIIGIGQGMFSSPNTSSIMGSVPRAFRGVASGMRSTFQNSGAIVSIGVFFSLLTLGLATSLPTTLYQGLTGQGIPANTASAIAQLPPTSALFAAFLGYNPMAQLVPANVLSTLPQASQDYLLGHTFFPSLISAPFAVGLHSVFYLSAVMCLVATVTSLLRGKQQLAESDAEQSVSPDAAISVATAD